MLHALNDICERDHLYTLDLSLPTDTRVTDREYHQRAREQEKLDMANADMLADGLSSRLLRYVSAKEKIRNAIDSACLLYTSKKPEYLEETPAIMRALNALYDAGFDNTPAIRWLMLFEMCIRDRP